MNHLACVPEKTRYLNSVFVSDVHLGSRYSRAEHFLGFLEQHRIGSLYLVGDFIDGWRLSRTWRWPSVYHRIIQRLLSMHAEGTRLYYTPGNHDEFLRHYLRDFGVVHVSNELVHMSVRGERVLVTHGDQFDTIEASAPCLAWMGASAYELLMWTNYCVNRIRRLVGWSDWHFSSDVKQSVKRVIRFISNFEHCVAMHAEAQGCEGIVCGHIHSPAIQTINNIRYFNTGDWVEHCTALVEHEDGEWEVLDFLSPQPTKAIVEANHGEDLLQHVRRGSRPRGQECGVSRPVAKTV